MKIITREILLNNEFIPIKPQWDECIIYICSIDSYYILIKNTLNSINRNWNVLIQKDFITIASVDIETVEHFNMLMKLMDINFKLKA